MNRIAAFSISNCQEILQLLNDLVQTATQNEDGDLLIASIILVRFYTKPECQNSKITFDSWMRRNIYDRIQPMQKHHSTNTFLINTLQEIMKFEDSAYLKVVNVIITHF